MNKFLKAVYDMIIRIISYIIESIIESILILIPIKFWLMLLNFDIGFVRLWIMLSFALFVGYIIRDVITLEIKPLLLKIDNNLNILGSNQIESNQDKNEKLDIIIKNMKKDWIMCWHGSFLMLICTYRKERGINYDRIYWRCQYCSFWNVILLV